VVFKDAEGYVLATLDLYIGETTNNIAEYNALLTALKEAQRRGFQRLKIYTDSQLLQRQMTGLYRVKSRHLLPLYAQARELLNHLKSYDILHIPREQNQEADRLANMAVDHAIGDRRSSTKSIPQKG
jgi:ribonuclease HI